MLIDILLIDFANSDSPSTVSDFVMRACAWTKYMTRPASSLFNPPNTPNKAERLGGFTGFPLSWQSSTNQKPYLIRCIIFGPYARRAAQLLIRARVLEPFIPRGGEEWARARVCLLNAHDKWHRWFWMVELGIIRIVRPARAVIFHIIFTKNFNHGTVTMTRPVNCLSVVSSCVAPV